MDWATHLRPIVAHLGQDGTLVPQLGVPVPVRVIYAAPYAVLPIGAGVESSWPRVAVMESNVPGIAHGDTVTVPGVGSFIVRNIERDPPSGWLECRVEVI